MQGLFTELLNMSIISAFLILAIILVRFVFKKAPKAIICILWALVGLRLICPISFESPVSMVPDARPVSYIAEYMATDEDIQTVVGKDVTDTEKYDEIMASSQEKGKSVNYKSVVVESLPYVWAMGMGVMALLSVVSYIRLRRSMIVYIDKEDNIRLCDGIKSPFVLGVIRPKIYVPSHLSEEEQRVVIAHEKAHIKRLDHLWKPLGYLILTLHWFNPLVWVAYALMCRDIEGACDEKVVAKMNTADKKLYSSTLLSCSAPKYMLTACPVAFGETNVKQRVRSVLNYKKPAFWIVISALVVTVVVAVVFMTNPIKPEVSAYSTEHELITKTILKENENDFTKDYFACESHEVLKKEELRNTISYYMLVRYGEYSCDGTKVTLSGTSSCYPAVITLNKVSNGNYELVEYWEALDGEQYADSIRENFPSSLHDKVFYSESYYNTLEKSNEQQAYEYFGVEKTLETSGVYPRFAGEVIGVRDDYYLLAPVHGSKIAGQSLEYVYVSRDAEYGSDTEFNKGDIITVAYENSLEITDSPYLNDVKSLSLSEDVQQRIPEYEISFYKTNSDEDEFYTGYIDADSQEMKNLEIYAFFPEEVEYTIEYEKEVYTASTSACYIILDKANGFATFTYADGYTIKGTYEENNENLIINGKHKGLFFYSDHSVEENLDYVFHKSDGGYIFDVKKSPLINTYYENPENPEEILNFLPDGSLFTNEFLLNTLNG